MLYFFPAISNKYNNENIIQFSLVKDKLIKQFKLLTNNKCNTLIHFFNSCDFYEEDLIWGYIV